MYALWPLTVSCPVPYPPIPAYAWYQEKEFFPFQCKRIHVQSFVPFWHSNLRICHLAGGLSNGVCYQTDYSTSSGPKLLWKSILSWNTQRKKRKEKKGKISKLSEKLCLESKCLWSENLYSLYCLFCREVNMSLLNSLKTLFCHIIPSCHF